MLNFTLAARRKRHDTQERYFYEWGIIHVALMITAPTTATTFKRYVQHYSISEISNDKLIHPLSEMEWDNYADHLVDGPEAMARNRNSLDYQLRMRQHIFGDKEFVVSLLKTEQIYAQDGFNKGGVKLIQFLKSKPGQSDEDFAAYWRGEHAQKVVNALTGKGILRKYTQGLRQPISGESFKGSLFEAGGVNPYAGIEELWFDSLDDLYKLRQDPEIYQAITGSEANFVVADECFSMVTTERVIYDYTLGDKSSPRAAVLNPDSLEAQVFRQGFSGWNIPGNPGTTAD